MLKHLLSGSLTDTTSVRSSDGKYVDRQCMLVYEGKFQSMDGEVQVTADAIRLLADNHNTKYDSLTADGKECPMKDCPPLQLDHSTSAKDTVGRLVGRLSLGEYDGKVALFGTARFIGEENIEKATDGRWTHLSVGADFEGGILSELTITPFPAAPNASLLKDGTRLASEIIHVDECQGKKIEIITKDGKFYVRVPEVSSQVSGPYKDIWAAKKAGKDLVYDTEELSGKPKGKRMAKLSRWERGHGSSELLSISTSDGKVIEGYVGDAGGDWAWSVAEYESDSDTHGKTVKSGVEASEKEAKAKAEAEMKKRGARLSSGTNWKLSKGDSMNEHEKLRKHLMETEKCSAEEADEKLSKMSDEEKNEHLSKLAKEEPEDKPEEKEGDKKLSAAKKKFAKLARSFRKDAPKASLEVAKIQVTTRLSRLRSAAKITPAEMKAIDVAKIAKLSKDAQEVVFESYEKRQPVIHTGTFGTTQADDVTTVALDAKEKGLVAEMEQTMRFSKGMVKRLASGGMDGTVSEGTPGEQKPSAMDHLRHLKHLIESGKHEEALKHLDSLIGGEPPVAPPAGMPEEHMNHLSALAESVDRLQNQFQELVELAAPVLGGADTNEGEE